jgi:tetratricopeptide (TPR) repeat protein
MKETIVNKILYIAALLALCASSDLSAATKNYCGELANAYGPFDIRQRAEIPDKIAIVEHAHFTSDVENGIKGNTSSLGGDLDYTLRAIPNHHRALGTLAAVALRDHQIQLEGMHYPVECWFNRALRFTPNDAAVYSAYGSYLFSLGKIDRAGEMFKQGLVHEPDNIALSYNLGLVYIKQHDYEKARDYAKKAYAAGYPLPGLKNKLIEAHQWDSAPAK